MIYLPDVNIWIALTSDRHMHHTQSLEWLQTIENDRLAFCRVTELGFLRLLTNQHVMGEDVLRPNQAWRVYDEWLLDSRVIFLPERAGFTNHWSQLGRRITGGPNAWTDAYLAAFAAHANAMVVTLDRKFPSLGKAEVKIL